MVKPLFTVTSMVQRSNKTWSETKKGAQQSRNTL